MVTAWDIPRNPLIDSTLPSSPHTERIRQGFRLFMETPIQAPRFTGNNLSCGNCHLNAGQRELALPLVGVAASFPEYNNRAARQFTLEDRIVGCFMRSENAPGANVETRAFPDTASEEIIALATYITWLSDGIPPADVRQWRKHNVIPAAGSIPVERLNPKRGEELFQRHCTSCHGSEGQGNEIGDKKAGPLWGPSSWNDGAGAARIYTLAGFIRYAMPYLNPGSLTDEEAQQIAAFIDAKPRPEYPFKDQDYRVAPVPPDAVYYRSVKRNAHR
jgi:thiosulfate dehydrogenase